DQKGQVLFEIKLAENAAFSTCVEFVKLTRNDAGEWTVTNLTNPIGVSKANGLEDLLDKYNK
ncbi:hypothetical protein, partial [Herbiconiux daphne]